MVKPAFENLEIELWVHPGKLGDMEPTLCVSHKSTVSGRPLLDALSELRTENPPTQRALTFAGCSRESAMKKLKLMLVSQRDDLRVMNIRCNAGTATIEMTNDGLLLLIKACDSWSAGAEDFGVSPRHSGYKSKELGKLDHESGELWFWGHRYAGP